MSLQNSDSIRKTEIHAKLTPIDTPKNKLSKGNTPAITQKLFLSTKKNKAIGPVVTQSNITGVNQNGNGNTVAKNVFNGGNGKYSAPIHIGDNIYEPQLIDSDAMEILKALKKIEFKYKIRGHNILLWLSNDSNLRSYCHQLNIYLVDNGYTMTISSGIESFDGIKIHPGSPDANTLINYEMEVGSKTNNKPFPIVIDTSK